MRSYEIDTRMGRGQYRVPQWKRPHVYRPNRTAAGITSTRDRSRKSIAYVPPSASEPTPKEFDTLRLGIKGTLDKLRGLGQLVTRKQAPCPCCGSHMGRLRLTDAGRLRLRTLRRKRGLV